MSTGLWRQPWQPERPPANGEYFQANEVKFYKTLDSGVGTFWTKWSRRLCGNRYVTGTDLGVDNRGPDEGYWHESGTLSSVGLFPACTVVPGAPVAFRWGTYRDFATRTDKGVSVAARAGTQYSSNKYVRSYVTLDCYTVQPEGKRQPAVCDPTINFGLWRNTTPETMVDGNGFLSAPFNGYRGKHTSYGDWKPRLCGSRYRTQGHGTVTDVPGYHEENLFPYSSYSSVGLFPGCFMK